MDQLLIKYTLIREHIVILFSQELKQTFFSVKILRVRTNRNVPMRNVWRLMVSQILRISVYQPRSITSIISQTPTVIVLPELWTTQAH